MDDLQKYYLMFRELLEKRFPFRIKGNRFLYFIQCFVVFGAFILALLLLMKSKIRFRKTFQEVAGWDVFIAAVFLNVIFSYGFGFFADQNNWWLFFPDAIIGKTVSFGSHGWMIIEDVLFYFLAVVMGQTALVVAMRLRTPFQDSKADNVLKLLWFVLCLTIVVFGVPFGSLVMRQMICWLYLPFGLLGLMTCKKYTWFHLWFITLLFVVCEFGWDVIARILGVWIFPDPSTRPGLYFTEIILFHIGKFPVVWQPEMTQMAFISGQSTLAFYFFARLFLRKEPLISLTYPRKTS
jgi:hypothetical protein